MEDDYVKNLAIRRKKDADKESQFKKDSNDRLLKICSTKVKTTMIGALDSIEKKLGKFWEVEPGEKMTNEQMYLKKIYEEIRQEILDKGNNQIRNLESEFEQYDIEWKRYVLKLPVIQKPKEQ